MCSKMRKENTQTEKENTQTENLDNPRGWQGDKMGVTECLKQRWPVINNRKAGWDTSARAAK